MRAVEQPSHYERLRVARLFNGMLHPAGYDCLRVYHSDKNCTL